MKKQMYTIGEMAALCNVTIDQLRHYDRQDIFRPAFRSPDSGYRFYTEEQISDVLLIKSLKKLGLPLKEIALLLTNRDLERIRLSLEENLVLLRRDLDAARLRYTQELEVLKLVRTAIAAIGSRESSRELSYRIVDVPSRLIVSTRYPDSCGAEDSFIYRYAELLNLADRYQLPATRMISAIFHDHFSHQFQSGEAGDLEIFMSIAWQPADCPHCRSFGGFRSAMATHVGHYRDMEPVYRDLARWATSLGHRVNGLSFQDFVISRTITDRESDYVTRIYLPLDTDTI